MNPLISVIIPAYNSEKYIKRSVQSVLRQTFDDYELIIINDGSTDKTTDIINSLAKEHKNIIVIQKSNGGVSSARNMALNVARGKFVSFLDSDDELDENFLKIMYEKAEKFSLDIVKCRMIRKKGKHLISTETRIEEDVIIRKEDYENKIYKYFGQGITVDSSCFALIKTTLAKKVGFNEKLVYGEDTIFMASVMNESKSCMYISAPLYYYIFHENEATEMFSDEKNINNLLCLRDNMYKKISGFIKSKYIKQKYDDAVMNVVYLALNKKSYKEYKIFAEKMREQKIGTDIKTFRKTWNYLGYLAIKFKYFLYELKSSLKI